MWSALRKKLLRGSVITDNYHLEGEIALNRIGKQTVLVLLALLLAVLCTGCLDQFFVQTETTTAAATTKAPEPVDPQVSDVMRSFQKNDLRAVILRTGLKDKNGEEVRCDFSMLKKAVFADYDNDGAKELVLLYDISEQTGDRGREAAAFVDERDGKAVVAAIEDATYGVSSADEANILTYYDGRVCKAHFINKSAYEAVLIDVFEGGSWKTKVSAYRHIADHDGVKLENGSCYIDHSGDELYRASIGSTYYSKEKFLNFRTPADNFDTLVTNLLAETLLP